MKVLKSEAMKHLILFSVVVLGCPSFLMSQTVETEAKFQRRDPFYSEMIDSLGPGNPLRAHLQAGRRGSGPHFFSMDEMKAAGIKHVNFRLRFYWAKTRLIYVKTEQIIYSRSYYDVKGYITDAAVIKELTGSDLELQLRDQAVQRATEQLGAILVGERLNKTSCGTTSVDLLDDERLPALSLGLPTLDEPCGR